MFNKFIPPYIMPHVVFKNALRELPMCKEDLVQHMGSNPPGVRTRGAI